MNTKTIDGELNAQGVRFGVVVGRFNAFIGERLLEAAVEENLILASMRKLVKNGFLDYPSVQGECETQVKALRVKTRSICRSASFPARP